MSQDENQSDVRVVRPVDRSLLGQEQEDLKPCPFCGANDVKLLMMPDTNRYVGICRYCGAQACSKSTKKIAAAAWNTRTPQADKS